MDTIGERIIFLRENLDLSQVKLAALIGITKMTLYKYEKNICEPRGEIIARLAYCFSYHLYLESYVLFS